MDEECLVEIFSSLFWCQEGQGGPNKASGFIAVAGEGIRVELRVGVENEIFCLMPGRPKKVGEFVSQSSTVLFRLPGVRRRAREGFRSHVACSGGDTRRDY